MTEETPKTLKEALARNFKELTDQEKSARRPHFAAALSAPSCAAKRPGDLCSEGGCVDGKKLVMYCDNSNGCTHWVEMPC